MNSLVHCYTMEIQLQMRLLNEVFEIANQIIQIALIKSFVLSRNINMNPYKTQIRTIVTCGNKTWNMSKAENCH